MTCAKGGSCLGMQSAKCFALRRDVHGITFCKYVLRFLSPLPKAPVSGGSQSAASVTPAVENAAEQARLKLRPPKKINPPVILQGGKIGPLTSGTPFLSLRSLSTNWLVRLNRL
jgi:hypothetical protein